MPTAQEIGQTLRQSSATETFGVGSDGLLLIYADEAQGYRFRMFNPDGSEAEMCGNGIRCFAKYLYDTGEIGEGWLEVDTLAGMLKVNVHPGDNETLLCLGGHGPTVSGTRRRSQ